jgi:glycerol-3-phosphate acyltransferase PlsY
MEGNEHLELANWPGAIACVAGAYIIGCFTTGYYLVRARLGQDIREMGSGSAGARNVGRFLGKSGFFLTVLGDFAKGALAVGLARMMIHENLSTALAVPAVVAGHLWPAQLKFRGGKGVVTSLGALLVFDYRLAFTFGVMFVVIFFFTRKTLLPAMFGFLCLPAACWFFTRDNFSTGIITILSATILFAHRKNLADEFMTLKSEPPKI